MSSQSGDLSQDMRESLIRTCRTVLGDELRSVTYFTDNEVDQLYLRGDLEQTADLVGFAEQERTGFYAHQAYRNTQLGEYQATIRMFANGYLVRVINERAGVWVTTDSMSIDRFEELSAALSRLLSE